MNCTPTPEVTCGTVYQDACINVTVPWPACFPTTAGPCYRQSDFNKEAGTLICQIITTIGSVDGDQLTLPTDVPSIIESIDLSALTACPSGVVPITPVKTTVSAELQNIYDILCANLGIGLNTPLVLGQNPGLDLKCLEAPCDVPISTLGGLLQALINEACGNQFLTYTATITQSGTSAPVATVLQDTFTASGITLTWGRTSAGLYTLTATGGTPFTANKTTLLLGVSQTTDNIKFIRTSATILTIQSNTATDAQLAETTVEIKVYP